MNPVSAPRPRTWLFALTTLFAAGFSQALEMPAIFGDGMVLQQQTSIPVWGFAGPGQQVTAKLDRQIKAAAADTSGVWRLSSIRWRRGVKQGQPFCPAIIAK
jgi:sialate O-acetylesterase